ncbi:MAG TPA: cyclic nucleotide-binding domain-containing protein [Bradyrhizobium sp.]|jgi:CRP-like cAMP-binding protein|nr:cyclic nucleotide-binding domain-containing protein [Bradyrhizobium sp.]
MSLAAIESDNFEILRSTDILDGVSDATVKKIAAVARPQTVDEGETVYSVGDPVRSAYVVAAGRLRFVLGGDGRPAAQGTIVPAGDILGWAALLGDQPRRIATVIALEECRLLEIEGETLLQILDQDARAGYLVMRRLARMITQSFLEQSTLLKGAT